MNMHKMCAAFVAVVWLFAGHAAVAHAAAFQGTTQAPASGRPAQGAQGQPPARVVQPPPRQAAPPVPPPQPPSPPGYVIGADDVLSIIYWRDKDMTVDVQVRPDGKISLALLNDVEASGLTPDQLREKLMAASKEYFEDPAITVVVKQINSRRVFVMGQVAKQGPFPLTSALDVLQLLSLAGGVGEFADLENIAVIRTENGKQQRFKVNIKEVRSGKKLAQNIQLKPGDTVVVP